MASLRDSARTTPAAVRDIMETSLTDAELAAFVNAASYTVDDIEAAEPDTPAGLLGEIETWLAAHLVTTRPELPEKEQQDSYQVTYLRETTYGEAAMRLDPSNVLAAAESGVIAFSTPDAKGTRYH